MADTPLDNQDTTATAVVASGALDNDEWLRLAREAFTGSNSYFEAAVRNGLINDLRAFQGQHPQGSKYLSDAYRTRSKFYRPKPRAAVRKNEAIAAEAFFQSLDVVSITPNDDDDPVQLASAEINKELLQYRLTKSIPWFLICMGAYQDAQVQGMVCSYQYWDPKKDAPVIKLRPLENVRFDPSADWEDPVNTSPYWIDMLPMYVKDVRARMKTIDHATGEPRWTPIAETEILRAANQYLDPVRLARQPGRIDPTTNRTAITEYTTVWVHRNIVDIEGDDYVYYTLGTLALLSKPQRLEKVYFHGRRPYVVGFSVIEPHKPYPPGNVRLTLPIAAEINEVTNQRIDNVRLAMNKRYFVKRNTQVDTRSLLRNAPASVTFMNDPADGANVRIVDTPDVTRSSYEEQDRLNLDFDDLAGSFSQASVNSNRKLNETVGGMNILTKDASQVTGYQLRTFTETWAEPVLRQLVLLEQHYETDDVILALAGKKANLYQRFGADAITDRMLMQELNLTVNVGVGATNPHDQLQNFLQGMTSLANILKDNVLVSYGLDVSEVTKEIFGKLGYKDGARFFPSGGDDPRIAQMQSMIQELQQQLKAKMPPEIVAATVDKLQAEVRKITADTVKSGVEASFSAIQTGEVIAAVPGVAPVADKIMEAAGYTAPAQSTDPGLPQPAGVPMPGLTTEAVKNHRTGVDFTPSGPVVAQNTHPNLPPQPAQPATPGVGAERGIETMRPDSTGA